MNTSRRHFLTQLGLLPFVSAGICNIIAAEKREYKMARIILHTVIHRDENAQYLGKCIIGPLQTRTYQNMEILSFKDPPTTSVPLRFTPRGDGTSDLFTVCIPKPGYISVSRNVDERCIEVTEFRYGLEFSRLDVCGFGALERIDTLNLPPPTITVQWKEVSYV